VNVDYEYLIPYDDHLDKRSNQTIKNHSIFFSLPFNVDCFDESNRRNFDFGVLSFVVSSLTRTELFFHIMTIIIIYETVITINGTRYTERTRK